MSIFFYSLYAGFEIKQDGERASIVPIENGSTKLSENTSALFSALKAGDLTSAEALFLQYGAEILETDDEKKPLWRLLADACCKCDEGIKWLRDKGGIKNLQPGQAYDWEIVGGNRMGRKEIKPVTTQNESH